MGCTNAGHKTFLVVCNIGLLFTGLSVLVLGVKMKSTLGLLMLDQVQMFVQVSEAVIATGFVVALTGGSGFAGACYEIFWLICVHLGGLGVIVIMEFSVGVTLLVVKNMVENLMETSQCGPFCTVTLRSIIMELAMPSAGLLMTVIIMEASMIYSAVHLFFHFREKPKTEVQTGRSASVTVQSVRMRNVSSSRSSRGQSMSMFLDPPCDQTSPSFNYNHHRMSQHDYEADILNQAPPPPYSEIDPSAMLDMSQIHQKTQHADPIYAPT